MFGIGAQEMVLIGLLCLLVFGPGKLSRMARDLGGFVRKARESVDEFKAELEVDGGHDDSWGNPGEYPEGAWGDERRELHGSPETPEDGAEDASPAPEGKEEAPEWVLGPVTYPNFEEMPRPEREARDADEPADA